MKATRRKKSYEELVDAVMEALPVRGVASIQQISEAIGSSWETAYRWLDLIIHIQGLPKVERVKQKSGRGEVYRRERRAIDRGGESGYEGGKRG